VCTTGNSLEDCVAENVITNFLTEILVGIAAGVIVVAEIKKALKPKQSWNKERRTPRTC